MHAGGKALAGIGKIQRRQKHKRPAYSQAKIENRGRMNQQP